MLGLIRERTIAVVVFQCKVMRRGGGGEDFVSYIHCWIYYRFVM